MRNISVPENYGFNTIICDYFYRSPFPTPTFTGARGAYKRHRGMTIHITEFKIHISYSENHDSTLMLGWGRNACKTIAADISMKFIVFWDVEMNGDISYAI